MVKYFSADWLAQSHHDRGAFGEERAAGQRPHVPCMVQPSAPVFGKGYLQPKPKPLAAAHNPEAEAERGPPEPRPGSPSHPEHCSSPNSEFSGYSSGYESEAAFSESVEVEKEGPQRRVRTKFTPEQIAKLEKIFNKHKYLDAGERVKTAQKLKLTETQVRTWFQNRRMKLKREVQDYLAPQISPVTFQNLHPARYHSAAAQRAHCAPAGGAYYPLPLPRLLLPQEMPNYHHHAPQLLLHQLHQFY